MWISAKIPHELSLNIIVTDNEQDKRYLQSDYSLRPNGHLTLMATKIQSLVITDVPFWAQSTGAHIRIGQLLKALGEPPCQAEALITQYRPDDHPQVIAGQLDYPIYFVDQSRAPQAGFLAKLKWQWRAIQNALGWIKTDQQNPDSAKRLNNYYSKSTIEYIVDVVKSIQPQVIVFEYLSQLAILKALPEKSKQQTLLVLDSHDVLWKRNEQFKQNGLRHWIEISQTEEEEALREFDLVIAIQPQEAEYFANVIGAEKVITTGLEFDPVPQPERSRANENGLTIGFLASDNPANVDAAQQILAIWAEASNVNPKMQMVLAGAICNNPQIAKAAAQSIRIKLLGKVENVSEFYNKVEVVWNPIQLGTGLKIKNLEALAYGKCLVTSSHGAEGIFPGQPTRQPIAGQWATSDNSGGPATKTPFLVADSSKQTLSLLKGLNPAIAQRYSQSGRQFVAKFYSRGTQYGKLRQKLATLYSEKST